MELLPQRDGDITRDTDEEAIVNSLKNIINTEPGTRRMLPTFACTINKMLFEPMTEETANNIKYKLIDAINRWDNRVTLKNLSLEADYDNNLYKGYFEFHIKNFPENIKSADFIIRRL
jgi:phage baseplate assembly protein W